MRVKAAILSAISIIVLATTVQAQTAQDYSGYGAYQSTYQVPQQNQPAEAAPANSPEMVQGRVQETAEVLDQPLQSYIEIVKTSTPIRAYSEKKYQAYEIVVNNTSPHHVQLLQAQVNNGLDEQYLAAEKAEEKQKKKRGFGAALKAASIGAGVAGHFVPYGGGGAWAARTAINQASYATNSAANAVNYSANADGNVMITGQYVKQVSNVIVTPGNKMSFQVVLPLNQEPALSLVVKDLATNQIVDINQ